MTGTAIEFDDNIDEIRASVKTIESRIGHPQPALAIIGETVKTSVVRNFEESGRPRGWKELSPVTLAKKKGGSILVGKGHAGGLMGSIHWEVSNRSVMVGTDKVYAAIHNFGGLAGKNKSVTIPGREYLLVQDQDWQEINDGLGDYILQGKL